MTPVFRKRSSESSHLFISGAGQYGIAALSIIITSGICYFISPYIGYQSVSFILLFVVSLLSIFMGIGPIIMASTLGALIWNFFFIPPKFTISIGKTEDILMFGMFFIIALVNGILTTRVRKQEKMTREKEERTNSLYQLTKDLADSPGTDELVKATVKNLGLHFGDSIVMLLDNKTGSLTEYGISKLSSEEIKIAGDVYRSQAARYGKEDEYTFYPLKGGSINPGVIALKPVHILNSGDSEFLNTFLTQISSAFEREFLNALARKAQFLDESGKLYKTLFNSISHEFRIPVSAIMSASESILAVNLPTELHNELMTVILKASSRLNRLIENLLNMSRLESGMITPKPDWCDIHDLINKVTDQLAEELKPFEVRINVDEEMPFVKIDFGLVEQVLYNLVLNAVQYASSGELEISASWANGEMKIAVCDRGPGFPEKEIPFIFNKFYRLEGTKTGGTGLGLSIAKGFTEAHKGSIEAKNRKGGGAMFIIKIPSGMPDVNLKSQDI